MAKLKDYSGEYIPDMGWDMFSQEALVKVVQAYAKLYLIMSGLWETEVLKKHGRDEGFDMGETVWTKLAVLEPREMTKVLNIQGTDIVAYLKMMQAMASFHQALYEHEIEIKDKNRAVITVTNCVTVRRYERFGDDYGIKKACDIEGRVWPVYAQFMNPKTKTKSLKLPPRKSPDDIFCQWEFWIEE